MPSADDLAALRAEIQRLSEECACLAGEHARLERIAAAAREAHAFFEGRRPGFAPAYPRDVLRAVFAEEEAELGIASVPRWRRSPQRKARPRR